MDRRGNFSVSAQFVGDDRGAPVGHTGMDQDDTRSRLAPALADQGPSTVGHRQPLAAPLDRVRDAGSATVGITLDTYSLVTGTMQRTAIGAALAQG